MLHHICDALRRLPLVGYLVYGDILLLRKVSGYRDRRDRPLARLLKEEGEQLKNIHLNGVPLTLVYHLIVPYLIIAFPVKGDLIFRVELGQVYAVLLDGVLCFLHQHHALLKHRLHDYVLEMEQVEHESYVNGMLFQEVVYVI